MQLDFSVIQAAVQQKLESMQENNDVLFVVDLDSYALWDTYLAAFPEGTNPQFRERTEHDCSCCRQFIKSVGGVVALKPDGHFETIWNIDIECDVYQTVADALDDLVRTAPLKTIFYFDGKSIGTKANIEYLDNGETLEHIHFHSKILSGFRMKNSDIAAACGRYNANREVLERSISEISTSAVELVFDLLAQGSLYRGAEKKHVVDRLHKIQTEYNKLKTPAAKQNYVWLKAAELGEASKIRNDVMGTLLVDITEGKNLDDSVEAFGRKMDPYNYKRPKATLITPQMKRKAEERVVELGLETALQRRYARPDDLKITNVLFADNSVKPVMGGGVLDILESEVTRSIDVKSFENVETVPVDKFVEEILPRCSGVEVFLDNKLTNRMVSLIAPVDPESNPLLRWGNNFSWVYDGDVTDSMIQDRVKAAGGRVQGDVRFSLAWWNTDDLDLHIFTPSGELYFGRQCMDFGTLDVDANNGDLRTDPVENTIFPDIHKMPTGKYEVKVNQYSRRNSHDVGFKLEYEVLGEIKTIEYDKMVDGMNTVIEFEITGDRQFKLISSWDSSYTSKEVWGIQTQNFVPVEMIMNSPNHWDGERTGNKHLFFMLQGCKNPEDCRGLYNEFLRPELEADRKVFEVLGSKLRVPVSDKQLSGIGFSETQRAEVVLRLTGASKRAIKVQF